MLIRAIGIDTTALESGPHEINTMALCFQGKLIKISVEKYVLGILY